MSKGTAGNSGFTPFVESFSILCQITNQIRWAIYTPGEILDKHTDFKGSRDLLSMDDDLKKTICLHVMLLVSTFMEEFKRLEKLAIVTKDERLQAALETLEPATNPYKGMEQDA